ncbi:MAG: hypothetical protein ACKOC5_03880, partial [Chloroflexota bacterium]
FYLFSALILLLGILPLSVRFLYKYYTLGIAPTTTLIILVFSILTFMQSILFAIWMDMDYNRSNGR